MHFNDKSELTNPMDSVLEVSDHITDCRNTDDEVIPAIPVGLLNLAGVSRSPN